MFDEIIEEQLREFNADLMIAAYVFTIIASFVIGLIYYTYIPFDKQIVDYYHTMSLTLNEPLMTFMANGLDTAGMILIALIGWIALNFLQGCCMAIDEIKEMRKERLSNLNTKIAIRSEENSCGKFVRVIVL